MKKSKVNSLIKKLTDEALAKGEKIGRDKERSKWEKIVPLDYHDQITWLDGFPDKLRTVVVIDKNNQRFYPLKDSDYFRPVSYHQRIDFEPVPMALSLASGQQIRWFHWKPIGPYPVSELAVV